VCSVLHVADSRVDGGAFIRFVIKPNTRQEKKKCQLPVMV
jgi:hypothetical protein